MGCFLSIRCTKRIELGIFTVIIAEHREAFHSSTAFSQCNMIELDQIVGAGSVHCGVAETGDKLSLCHDRALYTAV